MTRLRKEPGRGRDGPGHGVPGGRVRGQRPGQRRRQERDLQPVAQPDREHQPADQRAADTHRGGACHQPGARDRGGPAAAAASPAAASGSSSSLPWLWIALAAVVLIGLVVWIARASGRRSATASGWRSAMINTYAKGQALADAMRVADRPAGARRGTPRAAGPASRPARTTSPGAVPAAGERPR